MLQGYSRALKGAGGARRLCARVFIAARLWVRVRAHVHACVRVRMRMRVRVCVVVCHGAVRELVARARTCGIFSSACGARTAAGLSIASPGTMWWIVMPF